MTASNPSPTVLSISSHVVAGRVGGGASSFAFQRSGISVWPVPSVLYPVTPAANAPRGETVSQELFDLLLAGVEQGRGLERLDGLHVGYLRTPAQVGSVARLIARVRAANPRAIICVDPILGDVPGGLYVPQDTADAIKSQLARAADISTPNLFELAFLTGGPVRTETAAVVAARSLGTPRVVVTSAPGKTPGQASTLLVETTRAFRVRTPEMPRAPHGTGDLLAALFLARLLKGEAAQEALATSVASVHDMILGAVAAGRDDLPIIESQALLVEPATRPTIEEIK